MARDLNVDAEYLNENLVSKFTNEELDKLGQEMVTKYEQDEESRADWLETNSKWLKLVGQIIETKNEPWENASNVKYPLLTVAAIQFHARALPALMKDAYPVKAKILGKRDENKNKRALRVGKYMSYQILDKMDNWLDELDRLLLILPLIGKAYKKTYYSSVKKMVVSELVSPENLVIGYESKDFETAHKTHVLRKSKDYVISMQRLKFYRDVELSEGTTEDAKTSFEDVTNEVHGIDISEEADADRKILESHCWRDLDEDGMREPYIIWTDYSSEKVLRIIRNWASDKVVYAEDNPNMIASVEPETYFTDYTFIPDPNSSVYGLGFGALLGPTNEAINTLINQLLDAGTLNNLPAGFLGRGIRVQGGEVKFRPGRWITTKSTGDDLKKNVFPLPTKEPSAVLFQLLGLLIQSGEKLASINDIMTGENPGQNQPFSTTMTVLEQGLKVFAGIYRRIHRSLGREYKLIYRLNSAYLEEEEYGTLLDEDIEVNRTDFEDESLDIVPASDPNILSDLHAEMRNQQLMQISQIIPLNMQLVGRRLLEMSGEDQIEELMNVPPPQPDFETQLKMKEQEHKEQIEWARLELDASSEAYKAMKDEAAAMKTLSDIELNERELSLKEYQVDVIEKFKAIASLASAQQKEQSKNDGSSGNKT